MWKVKSFFQSKSNSKVNRNDVACKAIRALDKKYALIGVIGTGTYSDIIALWSKEDKTAVAAKVMHPKVTSKGELKLWPRLKHYNIVPVLRTIRREGVDIFLMPHYSRSLMDVLEEDSYRRNPNSFSLTTNWITGLLSGLDYMHASDICHLDLKVDNIFITFQDTAVIGDFSTIDTAKDLTNKYGLPRCYCPPEAWPLKICGHLPKVDGKAFDLWSVGMIFFYIFSDRWMEDQVNGKISWWDEIYPKIYKCVQVDFFYYQLTAAFPSTEITTEMCKLTLNLVKGVLRYKPEERPAARDILHHSVLQSDGNQTAGNFILLQPDDMWSHQRNVANNCLLKGKINIMIRKAVYELQSEKENKKMIPKHWKKNIAVCDDIHETDQEDQDEWTLQSLLRSCSSCCKKEKDETEPE